MNFGEVLKTEDGSLTILNEKIGEAYHSNMGAAAEARSLYLDASGFSNNISSLSPDTALEVLDVGLGLAYNALSTIDTWYHSEQKLSLKLTSLEINLDLVEALRWGKAPWSEGWSELWLQWSQRLNRVADFEYMAQISSPTGGECEWRVLIGDAGHTDLISRGSYSQKPIFNYVWQDAFSPQKNPEMWSEKWFATLAQYCDPRTVMVTYSVARLVRDNMEASGWAPERISTPSLKKRNWLRASLKSNE